MPSAPLQYCAAPACPEQVPSGYCRAHAVDREHARANYAVRRWYRQVKWRHPVWGRRAVCLRQHPYCVDCLKIGRYTEATEVHHVVKHDGDPVRFFDQANLVGLCSPCHLRYTMRGE